jgi:hypothetical protein
MEFEKGASLNPRTRDYGLEVSQIIMNRRTPVEAPNSRLHELASRKMFRIEAVNGEALIHDTGSDGGTSILRGLQSLEGLDQLELAEKIRRGEVEHLPVNPAEPLRAKPGDIILTTAMADEIEEHPYFVHAFVLRRVEGVEGGE